MPLFASWPPALQAGMAEEALTQHWKHMQPPFQAWMCQAVEAQKQPRREGGNCKGTSLYPGALSVAEGQQGLMVTAHVEKGNQFRYGGSSLCTARIYPEAQSTVKKRTSQKQTLKGSRMQRKPTLHHEIAGLGWGLGKNARLRTQQDFLMGGNSRREEQVPRKKKTE